MIAAIVARVRGSSRTGRARRTSLLLACALLAAEPALAQNFFERLFRPQQPAPQQAQPQAPRSQPQPQPAPRRSPPAQAPQGQGQSQSQGQGQGQAPPQQQAAPQPEPPPPPYEPELLRLAEIIGSLAFLRDLCAQTDAAEWPRRMQALLDAEGTTPGRRERIAGAYNRGFRAFGVTYRVCTPSATEATTRYIKEGEQIARSLSSRYGG